MKAADSAYAFLQNHTLEMQDKNQTKIPFPECLSKLCYFLTGKNNLFSQKIKRENFSFNTVPPTLMNTSDRDTMNHPLFLFNERSRLLKYFCDLFNNDIGPKKQKHLIMGNYSVGKSHFAYMLALILRKFRKKFCLINITNTSLYEISKLRYILREALYWFHDEIKKFQILKILYNIAMFRSLNISLTKDFMIFLMKLSIMKACENHKTIIFLQDGIDLAEEE